MVCEMTGSFALVVPLLFVNMTCVVLSHRFGIYKNQAQDRFHSPIYLRDIPEFILKSVRVKDVYTPLERMRAIKDSQLVRDVSSALTDSSFLFPLPVVSERGELAGMVPLGTLLKASGDPQQAGGTVAKIMEPSAWCLTDQTLYDAFLLFRRSHLGRVPVVEREGGRIVGVLAYQDVLNAYHDPEVEKAVGRDTGTA